MFLGVSLIGWILILFIYLPLASGVVILLWHTLRRWRFRWMLLAPLAAALAIAPIGDALWINWNFRQLCEGAGLAVTRQIAVEGYYDGGRGWTETILRESGFRFMEFKDGPKFLRIELANGGSHTTEIWEPTARYRWLVTRSHERVGFGLAIHEEKVVDAQTGQTVGSDTRYFSYPGWIDRLWWRYFDPQWETCPTRMKLLPEVVFVSMKNR